MNEINRTRLSEVRSVFNSSDDNLHFFKILNNSIGTDFNGVELAKPLILRSSNEIIWKTASKGQFLPFSESQGTDRVQIGRRIETAYKEIKLATEKFKNIPKTFTKNLMQIPSLDSVFFFKENSEFVIIITEWGFLKDKIDRRDDILLSVFPPPEIGVLIRAVFENNVPAIGFSIRLTTSSNIIESITDDRGLARLGSLPRGLSFGIDSPLNDFDSVHFKSSEDDEYVIVIPGKVRVSVQVVDHNEIPVKDFAVSISSPTHGISKYSTSVNGEFRFEHRKSTDTITFFDERNSVLKSIPVPFENQEIKIILLEPERFIEDEPVHLNIPDTPEDDVLFEEEDSESGPIIIQFTNRFSKPLKTLSLSILSPKEGLSTLKTDERGEIVLENAVLKENYRFDFDRYSSAWQSEIFIDGITTKYVVRSHPVFPWFWMILNAFLLSLLLICFFSSMCLCEYFTEDVVVIEDIAEKNIVRQPCNMQTTSGGAGETVTEHFLGPDSGVVHVSYNMYQVEDKLEVYLNDELVVSTFDMSGNESGYVGKNNQSGCCGQLSFQYSPTLAKYCIIIVTGFDQTGWDYVVDCPV